MGLFWVIVWAFCPKPLSSIGPTSQTSVSKKLRIRLIQCGHVRKRDRGLLKSVLESLDED